MGGDRKCESESREKGRDLGESRRGEVRIGKQLTKEGFVCRGFCMVLAFFYGWVEGRLGGMQVLILLLNRVLEWSCLAGKTFTRVFVGRIRDKSMINHHYRYTASDFLSSS